jgi:hypothetical protein
MDVELPPSQGIMTTGRYSIVSSLLPSAGIEVIAIFRNPGVLDRHGPVRAVAGANYLVCDAMIFDLAYAIITQLPVLKTIRGPVPARTKPRSLGSKNVWIWSVM